MRFTHSTLLKTAVTICFVICYAFSQQTPVQKHGMLKVDGNKIVGAHGNPVQLMGMSLYWSVWGPQKYYNENVVEWLVADWNIDLIRCAMAVKVTGGKGWIDDKAGQTAMVEKVVDAAIAQGIYVIVDWHSHEIYTDEAKEFFGQMTQKYKDCPNIIWEIFNEPIAQPWTDIAAYAEEVIAVIRENSPNLVLCGTRTYSQRVNEPADKPLSDKNTAYVLHFYAGTHGQSLRNTAEAAMNKGIALFISEWGTSSSDGGKEDRTVYKTESDEWIQWALDKGLSMANWSLGDIDEESASLVPRAATNGGWNPETDLTESGNYIRDMIKQINGEKYGAVAPKLILSTDGPGTIVAFPQKDEYQKDDVVTLKAVPNDNSYFVKWSGSASGSSDSVTIVMSSSRRVSASFTSDAIPFLTNGDFSDGETGWTWYVNSGASAGAVATLNTDNNKARIDIKNAGKDYWHVQIFQGGFALIKGLHYQLTFDASADSARKILVSVKHNGDPYTDYKFDTTALGTEMKSYQIQFTMNDENDDNARVEFNCGLSSTAGVNITNVTLKRIDKLAARNSFQSKSLNKQLLTINPQSGQLVSIGCNLSGEGNATLRIIDLKGRVLAAKELNGDGLQIHTFNRNRLPAGCYLVVLNTKNQIFTESILLSK